MADKKTPIPDNGNLTSEFVEAMKEGRVLDNNAPAVQHDPKLAQTLAALESGAGNFDNPMSDKKGPKR